MRSFDERKAEIFSRSKQRIAKRKKIIISCLPIFICLTVVFAAVVPQMRHKSASDETNKAAPSYKDFDDAIDATTKKGKPPQTTAEKETSGKAIEDKKINTTEKTTQTTTQKVTTAHAPTTSLPQLLTVNLMQGIKAYNVSAKQTDNAFIESQMRFSVDLFKASAKQSQNENILISPLSVQLALAMTANGADGKTRAEMEKVLGGGISIEDMNKYLKFYVDSLPSNDRTKLKFANSIWFRDDNSFTVEKDFLRTNATYYNAGAFKSPFNKQTVEDINEWVSDNTDGLIENIVDEINPNDMMYLINTVLFDARWRTIYHESNVSEGTFTSVSGISKTVDMMRSYEFDYITDGNAVGFIKEYLDDRYGFAALLPNEGININDYINGLSWEDLLSTLQNAQHRKVIARMPKFKYEYDVDMNGILSQLGIRSAFDGKKADFSKMCNSALGNIYIDEFPHKTIIDVNETGTTVAAVTLPLTIPADGSEPVYVTLDRPFVYMIIDNNTKTPIFIGAVMDIGE